jgi:AraC-like DNA-binding protein
MKRSSPAPYLIQSVSEQHRLLGLPSPDHPLLSVVSFEELRPTPVAEPVPFAMGFYTVTLKKNCTCKLKYGQQYFDFDRGVLSFIAPGQVLTVEANSVPPPSGWLLVFHPDFLRNYPLGQKIKAYGFFHYALHEALHLSEKEEETLEALFQSIRRESRGAIDSFSQDVLISYLDLLLHYANRFYNRQFLTRQHAHTDLVIQLETLLTAYLSSEQLSENGLPTVRFVAEQLNTSPKYLSDVLKKTTGQTAQQHIHQKLMDKAQELLTLSRESVSEIAYQLGFDHAQSFSKLFKQKIGRTPLEFRNAFG